VTAGGPAPLIAAALFGVYGSSFPIVLYIVVCALISLASAAVLPDRGRVDIDTEPEQVGETATSFAPI